jgi:hypothetical protein
MVCFTQSFFIGVVVGTLCGLSVAFSKRLVGCVIGYNAKELLSRRILEIGMQSFPCPHQMRLKLLGFLCIIYPTLLTP